MPKPISQLIPDFREALKDGIKDAAENIVEGLIEDGPIGMVFSQHHGKSRKGKEP